MQKINQNICALLFLVFLAVSNNIFAQTNEPDFIKKGNRTMVSLPVSVSDREGRYIPGLKKEDFTILQDNVKQNIAFFATYDEPLSVALLLDTSGSTEGEALIKIKEAAKDFIDELNETDKCLVATFDSQINLLSHFTSDHKDLKKAIDNVSTAGKDGTVLYQAITEISQKYFNNVQGRKVIVLLSDGKDFGSYISRKDLMSLLEESDVLIYNIFYQTGDGFKKLVIAPDGTVKEGDTKTKPKKVKPPKKKGYTITIPGQVDIIPQEEIKYNEKRADILAVDFLKELSDATAGRFYLSDTPNLRKVFKQVANELREQYRLGYYLKEKDVSLHDIIVRVNRPDAVVRTRGKLRGK